MENSKKTLLAYENNVNQYIENTPKKVEGEYKEAIDKFLSLISYNDKILELGSAGGRDADYIEKQGFKVERTDGAEGFIKYQSNLGKSIKKLDLLDFDLPPETYNLIFAHAVLLHFNKETCNTIIEKLLVGIKTGGYFAFSIKAGSGNGWSNHKIDGDRFYQYWTMDEISHLLNKLNLKIITLKTMTNGKWLYCIIQKLK